MTTPGSNLDSGVKRLQIRIKVRVEDGLRFSPKIRNALRIAKSGFVRAPKDRSDREIIRYVEQMSQCIRLANSKPAIDRLAKKIDRALEKVDWSSFSSASLLKKEGDPDVPEVTRATLLKPRVNEREKGVIFISFEGEYLQLLKIKKLQEFAEEFHIVLSPSWSPPHCSTAYLFPRLYPTPVFSLISNLADEHHLPAISQNYRVVRLFASNWVNPEWFQPPPHSERRYDIIMQANFGKFKRHHLLFRALRRMPRDLRVLLVGQPNGDRTADDIMKEAAAFGVQDRFELRQRLQHHEVIQAVQDARVSIILSKREGSCVGVTESFFADTPVGLLEGDGIGSSAFINEQTGRFLKERKLAAQLTQMVRESEQFSARKWALDNGLDSAASTRMLNDTIRSAAESNGESWTRDLAQLQWQPNPELTPGPAHDWVEPEKKRIKEAYGLIVP